MTNWAVPEQDALRPDCRYYRELEGLMQYFSLHGAGLEYARHVSERSGPGFVRLVLPLRLRTFDKRSRSVQGLEREDARK